MAMGPVKSMEVSGFWIHFRLDSISFKFGTLFLGINSRTEGFPRRDILSLCAMDHGPARSQELLGRRRRRRRPHPPKAFLKVHIEPYGPYTVLG